MADYLESETEMPRFLSAIQTLIRMAVDDYLQKGYDSLSVSFGCTGGQHRSVYAAEKTDPWLGKTFDQVLVIKHHREFL